MSEHMVVRGERIQQQLDEVSSVPDLEQNIERGFPETRKRQHATNEVTISNVQYIPFVGVKMLHVKSSSSSNGNSYNQSLQFQRVTYEPEDTDENVTISGTDGVDYHLQPIELDGHYAKVRCNCMDFHYRFANYNSQDKSLVGRPPPLYQRKTNRPPVNPLQVPGMCKHLLKLIQTLQTSGLVKP